MLATWLVVIRGKDQGRRFKLGDEQVYLIGRDKQSNIRLVDDEVSRRHAEIKVTGETIAISDLGSSNGTLVNGKTIDKGELSRGDHLEIGQTSFLVSVASGVGTGSDKVKGSSLENHPPQDGVAPINESVFDSDYPTRGSSKELNPDQWVSSIKGDLQFIYGATIAARQGCGIESLLEEILNLIFDWIAVDRGCVLLWDERSRRFKTKAKRFRTAQSRDVELKISKTLIEYVSKNREAVISSSSSAEDCLQPSQSILKSGIREAICVPIIGRSRILGFIYVDALDSVTSADGFNRDQLKLIVAIANQVSIVIENEQYYGAMVESERLTAVGQAMVALSHHIKNILQSINGGTHLIEAGLDSTDVDIVKKGWEIVRRNQRNMSNLVMDMVSFGKQSEPHFRTNDILRSIDVAIRNARQNSEKSGLEISLDKGSEIGKLSFDKALVERALENVLTHLAEALEKEAQGNILVRVGRDSECLRIVIKDDFYDISDTKLQNLFLPFAYEGEHEVQGIGLTVSKKIFLEHNGDIEVTRRRRKGLRFSIRLPLKSPELEHPTGTFSLEKIRQEKH